MKHAAARRAQDTPADETLLYPVIMPEFNRQQKEAFVTDVFIRAAKNKGLVMKGTTTRDQLLRTLNTCVLNFSPEHGKCPVYTVVSSVLHAKTGTVVHFVDVDEDTIAPFDWNTVKAYYRYVVGGDYVIPNITRPRTPMHLKPEEHVVSRKLVNAKI